MDPTTSTNVPSTTIEGTGLYVVIAILAALAALVAIVWLVVRARSGRAQVSPTTGADAGGTSIVNELSAQAGNRRFKFSGTEIALACAGGLSTVVAVIATVSAIKPEVNASVPANPVGGPPAVVMLSTPEMDALSKVHEAIKTLVVTRGIHDPAVESLSAAVAILQGNTGKAAQHNLDAFGVLMRQSREAGSQAEQAFRVLAQSMGPPPSSPVPAQAPAMSSADSGQPTR